MGEKKQSEVAPPAVATAIRPLSVNAGGRFGVEPLTGIILKGGKSRRMGEDKSMLLIDGKPLLMRLYESLTPLVDSVLISLAPGDCFVPAGMVGVYDEIPDQGPLMGIATALFASSTELNIVVPCDIPQVDPWTIEQLLSNCGSHQIVVPSFQEGRIEPLLGVYRKNVAKTARQLLDSGIRRVSALFEHCSSKVVALPNTGWYYNLNTPEDYERVISEKRHRAFEAGSRRG